MEITTTWSDLGAAWLLTYVLHSTLLLGSVWLATTVLGRLRGGPQRTLATQEALWKTALLGGLITATLQLGLGWQAPLGNVQLAAANPMSEALEARQPDRTVDTRMAVPSPAHSTRPTTQPVTREKIDTLPATSLPATSSLSTTPSSPATSSSATISDGVTKAWSLRGWTLAIIGLWLLGALAWAGWLAVSYRSFCYRIRNRARLVGGDVRRLFDRLEPERAVGKPVELSASSQLQSPLAKGVTRPEICLPVRVLSELSEQQQETLLAHELGHLVRRDPAWLLIARTIESVLFLQPLNRLARRRLQEISELRADDWAVTATGNPLDLARCLTRVADWNLAPVPVPSMAAKGSSLTRRVHRLLQAREQEGERPKGLWLAVAGVLLLVALIAPGVTAGSGAPEAPPAPPAPSAETPEAPEAPEAPETAEQPESPEAPETAPSVHPAPPASPAPSAAPTPSARPWLSRPPRVAPAPRVPMPSPRISPSTAPRIAWLSPPPSPDEPGEPGEAPEPDWDWEFEGLTAEDLEVLAELEAHLAATLEEAFEPLDEIHEAMAEQIANEMEIEMHAVESALEALDESLDLEMEALEEMLDGDLIVELPDESLAALSARIAEMNHAVVAEVAPLLDLDLNLDLRLPEVEELARQSAREARRVALEARNLARDGLSEEEVARLRDEARRLAEEMKPRREEIKQLQEQARELAREARERATAETHELSQRLREQQRQQMEELRQRLEALREQRSEEREQRREELRRRLEDRREQMEQQRQELRERLEHRQDESREEMRRRLEAQREEMEAQRETMRRRLEQEREERRLQMEEHRREIERERENPPFD